MTDFFDFSKVRDSVEKNASGSGGEARGGTVGQAVSPTLPLKEEQAPEKEGLYSLTSEFTATGQQRAGEPDEQYVKAMKKTTFIHGNSIDNSVEKGGE